MTFNQFNFERLGFEPKAGEADEDEMVRQLVISNMIKGDDAKASAKASEIYAAHADDISNFLQPLACKF